MRKHLPEVIAAVEEHGIRNVTLNTVAPTGSVGTLADTTTGIEPYFALKWTATTRIGTAQEKMSVLETIVEKFGKDEEKWPSYVVTAQRGITTAQHVKTQAKAQRWIDSSISKTVNLPTDSTVDDVSAAYIAMWRQGCKGGTVYVDKSRDEQVLHVEEEKKDEFAIVSVVNHLPAIDGLRPALESGIGPTFSITMPVGGSVHITFRCDPITGEPYDFFINAGKGEVAANAQAIARLISMILRWPNNKYISQTGRCEMIREQLYKIPGQSQYGIGPNAVLSFPDAVAQSMDKFLKGDYPLSTMPLGVGQLKELLEDLAKCNVPPEIIKKWFVLEQSNGEDQASAQAEKDFGVKDDTIRHYADICPNCNEMGWLRVPGECPHCERCGYKEC
jgi:ribonucleoside-diphosphate reductase alpha chain